tara:strand:- start:150 stop:1424 length:1275 start_codon:yes stop_codon:yes gene_type:complete
MTTTTPQTPPPLVYLYEHNASGYCTNARHGMDLFEQKLPALFASGFLRTTDPARATLFYHPACLVDTFFRARELTNPRNRLRLTRLYERRVLAEMDALGYSHMPHVVHALRCHTTHMPWGQVTWGNTMYPQLWKNVSRFRFRVCSEAFPLVDADFSLHMPFCPSGPSSPTPLRLERSVRVLFIGSELAYVTTRARAIHALNRTPGARLELLNRDAACSGSSNCRAPLESSRLMQSSRLEAMRDAVYTVCPAGDAPDSPRIYQALAAGSVPLIERDLQVVGFADWSQFSLRLDAACAGCRTRGIDLAGCACPDASMSNLPTGDRAVVLQRAAHEHARTFECEPGNAAFTSYVERSLRRFRACDAVRGPQRTAAWRQAVLAREGLECTKYVMGKREQQKRLRERLNRTVPASEVAASIGIVSGVSF